MDAATLTYFRERAEAAQTFDRQCDYRRSSDLAAQDLPRLVEWCAQLTEALRVERETSSVIATQREEYREEVERLHRILDSIAHDVHGLTEDGQKCDACREKESMARIGLGRNA
jgi:ABC-type uncharacterized transport system ATPase subunit